MNCPSCNTENRAERKFCAACGAALAAGCPSCGAANEPGERFCGECGTALGSAGQPSMPAAGRATVPLPASVADGRYVVRGFLGEGARKRVYLAHDERLDRDVAVALIKTDGLDAAGSSRIEREAQAMGRLGDHPNIVTVFDAGSHDGQPMIVTQCMTGGDLDGMLAKAPQRKLPLDEVLRIAGQVCQGIAHAHARGVIHRDLKPGNIWLTEDGTAKIGDFGLAVALDRSRLTMAGMMIGTASYMPPEQAMGGETTAASDLYAFGCVLYEMVAGHPPFVGDDTVAIISQHLNATPVAPTWHRPECPRQLESLILRLIEKDPKQRPASADEVLSSLQSIDLRPPSASTPAPQPGADPDSNPIYRRTFVGREPELKQLQQAFDAALSGQGSLAMLVGEPGIGKTTLTEQLAAYVGLRGGRCLVGHCYEEGSLSLPYLPFVEAMRSYAMEQDAEQLRSQLGSGAGDVARIVSEVRARAEVETPPPGNPEEERFRLFQAVTSFLRNAGGVRPLCIVLEDLHDADKGTMEMLVHLARNLTRARILLIGTYRDVEVDRTHPLSGALAELRRVESFTRIPLRGLDAHEVQRMLSNIAGQDVPYALAEAVWRQTEGNPLFVQEVIRFAAESGLIKREAGAWLPTTVDSLINYVPEGLRDVIGKRLSRLSEDCNKVLALAAVIGREFAVDVLRTVAGIGEEELLAALEEAMHVSVLEERSQGREVRYRFTHAFFRQTLYEEMIAPRRLRLHNEVAKALEQHYAGRVEEHAAELAEHFSHSSTEDDLRKAVHYSQLAAQRAAAVYAHGEAVRLLEQALQVQEVLDPKDAGKRLEMLLELGSALLSAGDTARVYERIAPEAWDLAERVGNDELGAAAADLAGWGMVSALGVPAFTDPVMVTWCERMLQKSLPGTVAKANAETFASWMHYGHGRMEEAWGGRRRALEAARASGDPAAFPNVAFAWMALSAPPHMAAEQLHVLDELADLPRRGRPQSVANMLFGRAFCLLNVGRVTEVDALLRELDEYADRVGDPYVRAWQVAGVTFRQYLEGKLEDAAETAAAFAAGASSLGVEVFARQLMLWTSAFTLIDLGRPNEALGTPEDWSLERGEAIRAHVKALTGQTVEAQGDLRRIVSERGIAAGYPWSSTDTLVALLEVAIMLGDAETAGVIAPQLIPVAGRHSAEVGSTVARQLGLASLLFGDATSARGHLEMAIEVATSVRDRKEMAKCQLALAHVLFQHFPDEREEAARLLDIAVREVRDMKMQPALQDAMRLKLEFQGITSSDIHTSIEAVASLVRNERPALPPQSLAPDGTVTLMFSDIEDSTVLTERLGDARWQELLHRHNALIREQVRAHGGFEVKTMGDGFMVAFQSARRALQCAIAIQRGFEQNGSAPAGSERVRVRIGLHAGEAIREADDFYGKNVILASRVAGHAKGGEILVSSLLKELTESSGDFTFADPRSVELKGLAGMHTVHGVTWGA